VTRGCDRLHMDVTGGTRNVAVVAWMWPSSRLLHRRHRRDGAGIPHAGPRRPYLRLAEVSVVDADAVDHGLRSLLLSLGSESSERAWQGSGRRKGLGWWLEGRGRSTPWTAWRRRRALPHLWRRRRRWADLGEKWLATALSPLV
jgi:hypothetical protein